MRRYEWAVQSTQTGVAAAFERLRPHLAHTFPFELDTFQKEAVVLLEQVGLSVLPMMII